MRLVLTREALTLAFVAETNMSLSSVPKLIKYTKVSSSMFVIICLLACTFLIMFEGAAVGTCWIQVQVQGLSE